MVAILVVLGIVLISGRAFAAAYVEILWQSQSGYAGVFWKRMLWEWGIRAAAAVVVCVLVLVNLRIASTTLGVNRAKASAVWPPPVAMSSTRAAPRRRPQASSHSRSGPAA